MKQHDDAWVAKGRHGSATDSVRRSGSRILTGFQLSGSRTLASLVLLVALLISWVGPESVSAQTASQEAYIRTLYQAYFQRNPGVSELSTWTSWFQRGSSTEDIHASFISSEEFYNRLNRDDDRWVTNVFRIVVGRNPTVPEFNYWKQRYFALGRNRRNFGLEFLKSMGNRQPGNDFGNSQNSLVAQTRQLTAQARNLSSAVNRELGGSFTILRMQVNSLLTATAVLQSTAGRANPNRTLLENNYRDCVAAYQGVQAGLRNQPGAFNSQLHLNQMANTLGAIRNQLGTSLPPIGIAPGFPNRPIPVQPSLPAPVWTPAERATLQSLTRSLGQQVTSLYYLLQGLSRNDYRYQGLTTDMQWYSGQVTQLQNEIMGGSDRRTVRRSVRQLQNKNQDFLQRVQGQAVDIRLQQGLYQVSHLLNQIRDTTGGGNNEPGFGQLPQPIPNQQQLLAEIDQAIRQCDRLIVVYTAYLLYGRPVQIYLADLRNTRQQLVVLRTAVVNNTGALQLNTDMNAVVGSILNLQQPWSDVTRVVGRVDENDMNGLKTSATRLRALTQ